MHRMLRSTLAGVTAALALTTMACNKDTADDNMATQEAPGTVAAAPAPDAALKVTDIDLGRTMKAGNMEIDDNTDDFKPNDTVHALVKTEGGVTATTLTARFTYQDGQIVDEKTETIAANTTGPQTTHFMLAKPSGWPTGDYKLHILVNGTEVDSKDFKVEKE